MGKKGGDKKKAAKGPAVEPLTPEEFVANYKKACKLFGAPFCDSIVGQLENEENADKTKMVVDEELGPAGVRALCAALLGKHPDFKPQTSFEHYTSLHFGRSNCGPDGCVSIAELLRLGGEAQTIQCIRIMDSSIGARGCKALGSALSFGCNVTLKTLYLQYDSSIGDAGCDALCRGLRTNSSLKRLVIEFCDVGPKGAKGIAQVMGYGRTEIEKISLRGNKIGGEGLVHIAKALHTNTKLTSLSLQDNCISKDHLEELEILRSGLDANETLEQFYFSDNPIGTEGCSVLSPALAKDANKNLKLVQIYTKQPSGLFNELNRAGGGGKKGKKGKKKKKK